MNVAILIDIGSTFTKVVCVDLNKEEIIARVETPTTVETNIAIGVHKGIKEVKKSLPLTANIKYKLACSSAAGGLRMAVIGLVPRLTVEAAKQAALTAGAKVIGTFSYKLVKDDILSIERKNPDIILLAGGTDGGDEENILHNARMLAHATLNCPIVVAGNRAVSDKVARILAKACKKEVEITENVMPELGKINVAPAQSTIRRIFIRRITKAKGLKNVENLVDGVVMPTPLACLKAAKLLATGTKKEPGIGELIAIDVGGATTDVYSIANGLPSESGVVYKGLPEPYAKRTVEGDLGLRSSAFSLIESAGEEEIIKKSELSNACIDLKKMIMQLNMKKIPETEEELSLDMGMARVCVEKAMERHAGKLEVCFSPFGEVYIQHGKDLTKVKRIIGTAGGIIHNKNSKKVLEEAVFNKKNPLILKPKKPNFYLDCNYIFYAVGLLSEIEPEKALRIMLNNLKRL